MKEMKAEIAKRLIKARSFAELDDIVQNYYEIILYDWTLMDLVKESKKRIKDDYNRWPVSVLN